MAESRNKYYSRETNKQQIMKIKKIAILVELENGNAHQVLATASMKEIILNFLTNKDGVLQLSDQIEPITFEPKK